MPAESWKLYKLTSEISSLTFGLFGGVEPDAYSRSRVVESVRSQKRPKADSGCERRPDMSQQGLTQERPQQAQMIQSHNCWHRKGGGGEEFKLTKHFKVDKCHTAEFGRATCDYIRQSYNSIRKAVESTAGNINQNEVIAHISQQEVGLHLLLTVRHRSLCAPQ